MREKGAAWLLCAGVMAACATSRPAGWGFDIPGSEVRVVLMGVTEAQCQKSREAAAKARLEAMSSLTGFTPEELAARMAAQNPPLRLVGDCKPVTGP
jgi:hypothetical protein